LKVIKSQSGRELLALCVVEVEGLKDFGVARNGTRYMFLDKIKKLDKKAGNDCRMALIEHSPYIALRKLSTSSDLRYVIKGIVRTKPRPPVRVVHDDEMGRYQKVGNRLFLAENPKIIQDNSRADAQVLDDFDCHPRRSL